MSVVYSLLLLALMLFGFGLIRQASSQSENLKVTNYSWYIDSIGDFHVVGEIQNVGSTILNPVVIGGIVYTLDGGSQSMSNPCVVFVNYMLPQQKAPFLMDFFSADLSWLSQGVDHVEFQIIQANETSSYQYPDLTITSSKVSTDAEGGYWVMGTLQNIGTETATAVRVVATFYNASNSVVAAGYSVPPDDLSPSGSASFKVGAFDVNRTATTPDRIISSYSLLVQAEGPLLSGTPPSGSPSESSSGSSGSAADSGSSGSSSNPIVAPGTQYVAVIVIVIIIIGGVLIVFNRRKSSKPSAEKDTKSKAVGRRRQSPKSRLRDVQLRAR
jgi:hypothetical protein